MKLSRPFRAASLALTVLATTAAPCGAEAPSRAILLLPACPLEGVSEQELRAALALELQADGVSLAEPRDGFGRSDILLEIASSCRPDAELSLRVLFHDRERARTLTLGGLPPGTRSRMLALSLAELVDRLEPETQPAGPAPTEAAEAPAATEAPPEAAAEAAAPAAPPEAPASPAAANEPIQPSEWIEPDERVDRPSSVPRNQSAAIGLAPDLRWFSSGTALFGGRLFRDSSRWFFGAGLLVGRSSSGVGDVDALLVQGLAGYRLVEADLGAGFSTSFGPRLGIGWIEVSGSSENDRVDATSAGSLYLDASVMSDVRYALSRHFRCSLGLEGGVARGLAALADGEEVVSYDGAFIAGFLGVMLSP